MKRLFCYLFAVSTIALMVVSCLPIESVFDEELLIGKWQRDYYDNDLKQTVTEYYRYDANGTGATWVPAEDVLEQEAQGFTWTLSSATLTHIHIVTVGNTGLPKTYTVKQLTSTVLEYEDGFGKNFLFTKSN